MDLNIIDFNNFIAKNKRAQYCIYRNLQLGHKVHIYNENSSILKPFFTDPIMTSEYQFDFSIQFEWLKLNLMTKIQGWFLESDMIFYGCEYDPNLSILAYSSNTAVFSTWSPIYIVNKGIIINEIFKRIKLLKNMVHLIHNQRHICESSYETLFYDCTGDAFKNGTPEMQYYSLQYVEKPHIHAATWLMQTLLLKHLDTKEQYDTDTNNLMACYTYDTNWKLPESLNYDKPLIDSLSYQLLLDNGMTIEK